MKPNDDFYMKEALDEAMKALESGNWPIGCVIVIDSKIVSRGYNKVYSSNNKINHAEIIAMNEISELLTKRGSEATLYATYEPCPMCLGAILLNHIKRVVYGTNIDESGGMCLQHHLPKRFKTDKYKIEVVPGVMAKECEDLFLQGEPIKNLDLSLSIPSV